MHSELMKPFHNDLVTLTMTFILKVDNLVFTAGGGGGIRISQTHVLSISVLNKYLLSPSMKGIFICLLCVNTPYDMYITLHEN